MPRYFVAIPLSDEVKAALTSVQPPAIPGMRVVGASELHLTLHFLGEITEQQRDAACSALASVGSPRFAVSVGGGGRFSAKDGAIVLWAGVEPSDPLLELHRAISEVLAAAIGFQAEARPYSPHVTLARLTTSGLIYDNVAVLSNTHLTEISRMITNRRRIPWLIAVLVLLLSPALATAAADDEAPRQQLLGDSHRILFLGDSITAAGQYVAYFDAWLTSQSEPHTPMIIDAGLPSETVSGLSEDGHAGGAFPRPDLAERLDRVLALAKPDLVIACYGINCAIYEPFDGRRLKKYQEGIEHLKSRVEAAGAKLVLMTPPCYDDQRAPKPFSYNRVLDRYSDWLLQRRQDGWLVVDLHGPMTRELRERRMEDATFTFQPDGVHPNNEGHWFIAQQLIRWFGGKAAADAKSPGEMLAVRKVPKEVLNLVEQRVRVLRDAYVASAGHKRPGVAAGMPVAEAEAKAGELSRQIKMLASPKSLSENRRAGGTRTP